MLRQRRKGLRFNVSDGTLDSFLLLWGAIVFFVSDISLLAGIEPGCRVFGLDIMSKPIHNFPGRSQTWAVRTD